MQKASKASLAFQELFCKDRRQSTAQNLRLLGGQPLKIYENFVAISIPKGYFKMNLAS